MQLDHRLIYDIGLHRGEDTDFYLKKGYRVVAFDANPALIETAQRRYAKHIAAGEVTLIEGAIAPETENGKVSFFLNSKTSEWGTIDSDWVARNTARGTHVTRIDVARIDIATTFRQASPTTSRSTSKAPTGWCWRRCATFRSARNSSPSS